MTPLSWSRSWGETLGPVPVGAPREVCLPLAWAGGEGESDAGKLLSGTSPGGEVCCRKGADPAQSIPASCPAPPGEQDTYLPSLCLSPFQLSSVAPGGMCPPWLKDKPCEDRTVGRENVPSWLIWAGGCCGQRRAMHVHIQAPLSFNPLGSWWGARGKEFRVMARTLYLNNKNLCVFTACFCTWLHRRGCGAQSRMSTRAVE